MPLVFTHHTRFADYGHYLGPLAGVGGRSTDAYLRRFWSACAAIVAPDGRVRGVHRKNHPFLGERRDTAAGRSLAAF